MFARKGPPAAAPASDDPAQSARARARQRLVGATLLLVAGVAAFALLFETKPRPLALDTPIVSARAPAPAAGTEREVQRPLPVLPARPAASASAASAPVSAAAPAETNAPVEAAAPAEPAASAGRAVSPAPAKAEAPRRAAATAAPAPAPVPAPAPAPVAAAPAAAAAPAPAASAAASAPRTPRYVVQVGAFSEPATAREVRLKVEKLGLKTYTQVVETEGGRRTRVRIGPFASREEAMQTLARIQAANLPGVVLAL